MSGVEPLDRKELTQDLQAAVAARRELGADYEDPLVETFIARMDQHIEERVKAAVAASADNSQPARRDAPDVGFFGAVFALTIPIMAIAGGIAHLAGVIAVAAALLGVNVLYFMDRWMRFSR